MTFLAPAWFALLLLAAPIVFLHMRRRKRLVVSSLLLWQGVAGLPRPSHALRRPPLSAALVLQLIALALAVVALARPVVGARGADHLIILLDAGSTQDEARFAAALAEARRLIAATGVDEAAVWSLVLVNGRPTPLAVRWPVARAALADIGPRLTFGGGAADWREAAMLARRIATGTELEPAEAGRDARGQAETVRVVLLGPTVEGAAEALAVVQDAEVVAVPGGPVAALASAYLTPGPASGQWRVGGEVVGAAEENVSAAAEESGSAAGPSATLGLTWSVGRGAPARSGDVDVRLEPTAVGGSRGAFDLLLELSLDQGPGEGPDQALDRGQAEGEVSGEEHDHGARTGTLELSLGSSSAVFVVHAEPVTVRVLYLGPGNAPLARALRALPYVELEELPVTAGLPADAAAYALVILDRVVVPEAPRTSTWWLASARTESEPVRERNDGVTGIGPWADDPLVTATDWRATSFGAAWSSERLPGAVVLVDGPYGPLMQLRRLARGLELRTAFDLAGSDWPDADGFPLFVRDLLDLIEPSAGRLVEPSCLIDVGCPLPAGTVRALGPRGDDVPLGSALHGSERLVSASFVPDAPGLYRLTDARGGTRSLAVSAFADRLPALASADGEGGRDRVSPRWIILGALLLVLVAEAAVWGRSRARAGVPLGHAPGRSATLAGSASPTRLLASAPRAVVIALVAFALSDVRVPQPARDGRLVVIAPAPVSGALPGTAHAELVPPDPEPRVDLELSLDLGTASVPPGVSARLLVGGDGLETRGDLARAAARAQARGMTLDALAPAASSAPDAVLRRVAAPAAVLAGDRFELHAVVHSNAAGPAHLVTYRTGETVDERDVFLEAGDNLVTVEVVAVEPLAPVPAGVEAVVPEPAANEPALGAPGAVRYEMVVGLPGDAEVRNDSGAATVRVAPAPRLLLVSEDAAWARVLASAIEAQGVEVALTPPGALPIDPAALAEYGAAALMNVPAAAITVDRQLALETAVFDLGLPLLLLGGESAFGPGGYYETPLERLSPTSSLVPREAPELAIAFVLDRSNSMRQYAGDSVRLDIAKVATLKAHELLPEGARSTLIAFDSTARTLVPLGPAAEAEPFRAAVLELDPRGGTNLYPALVAAYEQLAGAGAAAAHVIVMSDGLSQPGDFPGILGLLREANVTVSTIAIGPEADAEQLREVARLGGGTFHASTDFSALPGIMAHEVLLQSGELTEERDVRPTWQGQRPPYLRAWPDEFPAVAGYVPTSVKPEAKLHLSVTDDKGEAQPLLASWHYGAGEVVAFTAHAAGPWTREWLDDASYPVMWAHLVRQLAKVPSGAATSVRLTRDGDLLEIATPAPDAVLTKPDGTVVPLRTRPAAAGYATEAFLDQTGVYLVASGSATVGLEVPYLALLDSARADSDRLAAAALATGGGVVADLAEAAAPVGWYWPRSPAWPTAVCAALLALLLDLTWRYAPDLLNWRVKPRKD